MLTATHFASVSSLTEAIKHYERLYNHCIPQKAIGYNTPIVALKEWHKNKPDLFKKKVYDLSGLDIKKMSIHLLQLLPKNLNTLYIYYKNYMKKMK